MYIYIYIYNGEISLKHFKVNGFLSNGDNISFLWNTDGYNQVSSAKLKIWCYQEFRIGQANQNQLYF